MTHFRNKNCVLKKNFAEIWQETIQDSSIKRDTERAAQLEQLFKYHATFRCFEEANQAVHISDKNYRHIKFEDLRGFRFVVGHRVLFKI